jgi:hypothetical protein
VVRKSGEHEVNGKLVSASGAGAWKNFAVVDQKTGEVEIERKFYKKEFCDLFNDPETAEWAESLVEAAFVKKMSNPEEVDVDTESYEEVKALQDVALEELVDPEVA